MQVKNVNDKDFAIYGRIISSLDVTELMEKMKATPLPEDVIYKPSDEELEKLSIYKVFSECIYGSMPVQIGYCNGYNKKLNGLEYHRSSEINVAVTDMILLLGRQQDIENDYTYETSKVEAFFIPAGTVIEIYATTLHYAPCGVDQKGFKCVVVLPKGTNYNVKSMNITKEDKLLAATNKWLIAHKEANIDGAFIGLKGENITVE